MLDDRFSPPRNRRLPTAIYRDPSRVVFITIRATRGTSPFAAVQERTSETKLVRFHHELGELVLSHLAGSRDKYRCDVFIACLMPDHLHFLAHPREPTADVLTMVDRFKGETTRHSWKLGIRGRLWQPRSFDHVVRREESVLEKAEYIANNPVRKGYVGRWQDWAYTRRWDEFD